MRPRRLPPLLALRAFEAVARHSSIKAAAEELAVTPGAISQQIKKLEGDLDLQLLERVNRGVRLTAEGVKLQAGLSSAFLQIHETIESIVPTQDDSTIVFASANPFITKWLIPSLPRFFAEHGHVDIRFVSSFERQDYAAEAIDIGVRLGTVSDDALRQRWFRTECVVPLASPDFIETQRIREPRDLQRVPLVDDDHSWNPRAPRWRDWFEAAGLPIRETSTSISFQLQHDQALDAAIQGNGVVLGFGLLALRAIQAGQLVFPFGPALSTHAQWHVLTRKHGRRTDVLDRFEAWLVAELEHCLEQLDELIGPAGADAGSQSSGEVQG